MSLTLEMAGYRGVYFPRSSVDCMSIPKSIHKLEHLIEEEAKELSETMPMVCASCEPCRYLSDGEEN